MKLTRRCQIDVRARKALQEPAKHISSYFACQKCHQGLEDTYSIGNNSPGRGEETCVRCSTQPNVVRSRGVGELPGGAPGMLHTNFGSIRSSAKQVWIHKERNALFLTKMNHEEDLKILVRMVCEML